MSAPLLSPRTHPYHRRARHTAKKEESALLECTFHPVTNSNRVKVKSYVPLQERAMEIQIAKRERLLNQRDEVREQTRLCIRRHRVPLGDDFCAGYQSTFAEACHTQEEETVEEDGKDRRTVSHLFFAVGGRRATTVSQSSVRRRASSRHDATTVALSQGVVQEGLHICPTDQSCVETADSTPQCS